MFTLVMILVTAILGSILLRVQGFATLHAIQQKSASGAVPGKELVNGVMILVAGVLLLTPGFVTDSIGFLLFFPPFRAALWSALASKVVINTAGAGFQQPGRKQKDPDIVDLDPSEYSETQNADSPWNKKID